MIQLKNFTNDDSGAVTVDWVVLTAAIVGIAIAVITLISSGVEDASEGINDNLLTAGSLGGSLIFSDNGAPLPEGYENTGWTDTETGDPVYFNPETDQVIIGDGEPSDPGDFDIDTFTPPEGI